MTELLATAEGRVLERVEIHLQIWGYTMVRGDCSVDVFVRKLCQKLANASPNWRYIHTHFGSGYHFASAVNRHPHRSNNSAHRDQNVPQRADERSRGTL